MRHTWDVQDGITVEEITDSILPESCRGLMIDNLDITFRSVGYYLPMSMYGGADHMGWPAEGDDERSLSSMVAWTEDGCTVNLTEQQKYDIFECFRDQVEAAELPSEDY